MMIKNSKQEWGIGCKVTIGFVKNLEIIHIMKNGIYILQNNDHEYYKFDPYRGLTKLSISQQAEIIAQWGRENK